MEDQKIKDKDNNSNRENVDNDVLLSTSFYAVVTNVIYRDLKCYYDEFASFPSKPF